MRKRIADFSPCADPPDFGRFYGSRSLALRAWCSPKTSLIAHAKHGFTDGTVKDCVNNLLLYSRRVAAEYVVCYTPPF
jgi:hypothetical protein